MLRTYQASVYSKKCIFAHSKLHKITGIHPILPALVRKRKQVFVSLTPFGNKKSKIPIPYAKEKINTNTIIPPILALASLQALEFHHATKRLFRNQVP